MSTGSERPFGEGVAVRLGEVKKEAERLAKARKAAQHSFDVRLKMLTDVLAAKKSAIATMMKIKAESKANSEVKASSKYLQAWEKQGKDIGKPFRHDTIVSINV